MKAPIKSRFLLILWVAVFFTVTLRFISCEEETTLTLSECIRMAMRKNISLSFQRLNPEISRAKLLSTWGDYDLNLTSDHSYSETNSPTSAQSFSSTRANDHSIGLSQKIPFGTTFKVSNTFENSSSSSSRFDDNASSFWGASLTQPLLKNFGTEPNLFNMNFAKLDISIEEMNYQGAVDQKVTDVANAFYELVFARQDLASKQASLAYAKQLQSDNQTKLEIGTGTRLDVSQANAEVASRTEEVIRAERAIKTNENTLKLLITDQFGDWLHKSIIPDSDSVFENTPPSLSKAMTNALTNRPDFLKTKKDAEQKNLQLRFQRNQEWPQLDLTGSYGLGGQDRSFDSSLRDTAELDKDEWLVGLSLKIPLQNRLAKGQLQQAKLLQQQSLLQIQEKEQSIMAEVDNALGDVLTNQKRVESTETALLYAKESLEAEQEKLKAGASTTFTILLQQRDLATAQSNALRAKTDLDKSLAELHRVQGLSLVYAQEVKTPNNLVNP